MKCIRFVSGMVVRTNNSTAEQAVRAGMAVYAPKSEWKKEVRDAHL